MQCLINSCFTKFFWGEIQCSPVSYRGLCIVICIVSWLCWWYTALVHTSKSHAQSKLTRHASTKLSSLSCLIALKLSNTQVYVKNRVTKTVGYVCDGKQLGKKSHVYIRSVWQQRNISKYINKSTALLSPLRLGLWIVICARQCSQRQNRYHALLKLLPCVRTGTPLSLAKIENLQIKEW